MVNVGLAAGPSWWRALNPPIYLVSILPGAGVWLLGSGLGADAAALWTSVLGVVLLQHAVNVFNDAKDWELGADVEKHDSWVRVHGKRTGTTRLHASISLLAAGLLGLLVLFGNDRQWVLGCAAPFVLIGLLYNAGEHPLSYSPAGEWATALCYGPGVVGGLWLSVGLELSAVTVLAMLSYGSLAAGLLLSHQPPQIDTDRAAGKRSFAVRHGAQRTYRAAAGLYTASLLLMTAAVWHGQSSVQVTGVFTASGAAAVYWVLRERIHPKRLLLGASVPMVLASLAAFA
jgi:1,4-dihydroxy-2-naphthoate octaprenyltransferase